MTSMTPSDPTFVALQTALSGRFSIERELGRGGMGIVYLARDVQLQRQVAIKLLSPALSANPAMRERFLREAHLAAQCFHPHIVPIHAVEESGNLAWFVMAYVRGESLAERVRRVGPLPTENVRRLGQDIGWALSYAHERGLIHRDVKPENILIDSSSERFLLADFGIALNTDDVAQRSAQRGIVDSERVWADAAAFGTNAELVEQYPRHQVKLTGAGTPRYMAPEQARGDAIDGRADLYALGASLFFAASARAPFEASTSATLLYQHATQPAPGIRTFAPGLPVNLADAIDQCLAKIPDQRFVNASAFVEAIKPLESQSATPAALIPAREHMASAKTVLGWGTAVGTTSVLLMIGEQGHSFSRDIILAIGVAISGFMAFVAASRSVESLVSTGKALRSGVSVEDAERALSGEISPAQTDRNQRSRSIARIVNGVIFALAQGHLSRIQGMPEIVEALGQVFLLFAPVYFVGRGVSELTRGTMFRRLLHNKIEIPLARGITRLARKFFAPQSQPASTLAPDAATELFLERAVNSAIARLSPAKQQELADVAGAANALAHDAERLREKDAALRHALRLARQEHTDEARHQKLTELESERLAVQNRLTTTIAALETMRLDLMRLESSPGSQPGLTTHLGVVRDLAHRVDAAAELRAYLAHSTPTPV